METITQSDTNSTNQLSITQSSEGFLTEIAKWTKFLSIIGFIFSSLIIIMGLSFGSIMTMLPSNELNEIPSGFGALFGILYIALGLLYFFPAYYLFKYSQKLKLALNSKNSQNLEEALGNQKSFFKFFGVMAAIGVVLYGFSAIIGIIVFLVAS